MEYVDNLKSDLLEHAGFVHAFFTRLGGVSRGPFESLNLSLSVGDDPEHVEENLRRAAATLGVNRERLYVTRQVHGCDVVVLGAGAASAQVSALAADANVSNCAGVACGVRTADCVPILLADPESGRVAAVHAGWRGVACNIAGAAVKQMQALGSRPNALLAAIGPHISVDAFEVGEDVAATLARCAGGEAAVIRAAGRKPHVDLARILGAQLEGAGIEMTQIERVRGCTFAEESSFFSHRRDGAVGGRMLSAIVSRESVAVDPR